MLSLLSFELTMREIVADLPRDGGALFVLLLMLAFVAFIWLGSRKGSAPAAARSAVEPPRLPATAPAAASPPGTRAEAVSESVRFHPEALPSGSAGRRLQQEAR